VAVKASPRAVPQEHSQHRPPRPPPADSQAVPSLSSQTLPQVETQSSSSEGVQQRATSPSQIQHLQSSSSGSQQPHNPADQLPSSLSVQPVEQPYQFPASAAAVPSVRPHANPSATPSLLSTPSSSLPLNPHLHAADSASLNPPSTAAASSVSKPHLRVDSGHSAESRHKAQPEVQAQAPLSTRSQRHSPLPQELLAGLGSALRAQTRLRRKAMAMDTASPEETGGDAVSREPQASPSGQLSFDHVELKSNHAAGTVAQAAVHSLCLSCILSALVCVVLCLVAVSDDVQMQVCCLCSNHSAVCQLDTAGCCVAAAQKNCCLHVGLVSSSTQASPSGRAGLIAASPGPSRLYQKMASDPGRASPDEAFGPSMIASHSPQQSGGSTVHQSRGHAQRLSHDSLHAQPSSTAEQLAHSGPSIELVGSEMYEFELEHEQVLKSQVI